MRTILCLLAIVTLAGVASSNDCGCTTPVVELTPLLATVAGADGVSVWVTTHHPHLSFSISEKLGRYYGQEEPVPPLTEVAFYRRPSASTGGDGWLNDELPAPVGALSFRSWEEDIIDVPMGANEVSIRMTRPVRRFAFGGDISANQTIWEGTFSL